MLLGLDTTTERLHLALVAPARAWTRALRVEPGQSHSTVLLPALQALLTEAGIVPSALTGCITCVGPGGFTSLRTGVATAEGLALTGVPVWGFSAFELRARALRVGGLSGPSWILLDGQRTEAFAQKWDGEALTPATKHPSAELPTLLGSDLWWAPAAFRAKLEPVLGSSGTMLEDEENVTLQALVELCREKTGLPPENPLVPFYLRETDAEMNFPHASAHLSEALRRGHAR
ncbi:MAG: tRNA (adenosine(37)-N6)-threonylcarbamoyltransferase complex dimerization subunit type 1 TsaB [Holophaga sp.]|nr:tRNA (adenosine(37)-N6)-threonylcarbamoyltransferase complex dimerization subunit type 1 TsaB [Holophaga sp.]